ncbi:hypothetical protein JD844_025894 [Phrynosoma platyrhinos]|uniref:Uncharacterized protein n=1 Tax=Phrynosoma platyrhinos TaxID=52577 RepID=A0ABQ7T039_PHRPL|nr:hypothetical protein JD844_025894 [Phrynosoma platyrhinos]
MPPFRYRPNGWGSHANLAWQCPQPSPLIAHARLCPSFAGRMRTNCSQCEKTLTLQTSVKILYGFVVLLVVAVVRPVPLGILCPEALPSLRWAWRSSDSRNPEVWVPCQHEELSILQPNHNASFVGGRRECPEQERRLAKMGSCPSALNDHALVSI